MWGSEGARDVGAPTMTRFGPYSRAAHAPLARRRPHWGPHPPCAAATPRPRRSSADSAPTRTTEGAAITLRPRRAARAAPDPHRPRRRTTIGIAGDDFVVLASDTRLSLDFSILSRNVTKTQQLCAPRAAPPPFRRPANAFWCRSTPKCLIGTGGCRADIVTLHKVLAGRIEMYAPHPRHSLPPRAQYGSGSCLQALPVTRAADSALSPRYKHDHEQDMRTTAVAQMLSTTLYGRRFFPYYAFNVVAGLDDEGKGAVFTYDAVGSFERTQYAAQGAGQKMMIPVLDNVIGFKNREDKARPLTAEETVEIVKDIFVTAGERDIHTGDAVDIRVVRASGVEEIRFDLKRD